jgi:hypothetical protein
MLPDTAYREKTRLLRLNKVPVIFVNNARNQFVPVTVSPIVILTLPTWPSVYCCLVGIQEAGVSTS